MMGGMNSDSERMLKPQPSEGDPTRLLLGTLDFYRDAIERKLVGLDDSALRSSVVPSGWTPLQLLKHLVFMERRWLRWGFLAEPVERPWGDNEQAERDAPWHTSADDSLEDLLARMHTGGSATRRIATGTDLAARGAVGGRFDAGVEPPTLAWILVHVLQEYARHAGHLDVVRELADGTTGE